MQVPADTRLLRAAQLGDTAAVEALTKADGGADISARNSQGASALVLAAEAGQAGVIDVLLRRGADTTLRTNKGKTALEIVEEQGLVELSSLLSRVSVAEYLAQLSQEDKDNSLTKAAANGHAESARLLVEAGADTTFRDKKGKTALEILQESMNSKVRAHPLPIG